jgi:hypothetical protein
MSCGPDLALGRGDGSRPVEVLPGVLVVGSGLVSLYRVEDIAAALQQVRDTDGQTHEVGAAPYGLESLCAGDQGTPRFTCCIHCFRRVLESGRSRSRRFLGRHA